MNPLQDAASLAAVPFRAGVALAAAARAWITLEPRHWSALADRLAPIATALPAAAILHRLHGQSLRSGQRPAEAAQALRTGLARSPGNPTILRELGRSLRLAGYRAEAVSALQQAAAQGHAGAIADLLRLGERDRLPVPQPGVFARQAYAEFVAANPVPAPPATPLAALFSIRLTEGAFEGSRLAASLASQTHNAWTVNGVPDQWAGLPCFEIPLPANARLDPHALAWLNFAVARTGCDLLCADHDHETRDGQRCDPCLLPGTDRLWRNGPQGLAALEARRATGGQGNACHVPLVLLTLPVAQGAPRPLPDADPQPLSIIIPTRDNPAMLGAAIASLRAMARRPDLLQFVIVDNGSRTSAARSLLTQLAQDAGVRIVPFPEAFNWSRASNLGARHAAAERLLFLNDDTEMRTDGWDRILSGLLADPQVGLAGARMLYPDGRIQHAGFVFGMDNGPQHDGRWREGSDAGPAGRWTAIREAVAVTGAFIAIGQADFAAAGGFDEQGLAIDFADVDLCLKLRAQGRIVAYCGAITLLHHESVSRGLNVSRAKRRRMRAEWQLMQARWGEAIIRDPFHHPAWAHKGVPHDGVRALEAAEIVAWIDTSASSAA